MVKIMLDSASDGKNIHPHHYYIPITVDIGGQVYKDSCNLQPEEFYELLATSEEFPKTAQPSPEEYIPIFEEAKEHGDEIVYLCVSGSLSGTLQSANIAKGIVDYDGIHIVDTRTASHVIGMLAQYADKLVKEGLDAAQITEKVLALRDRQVIFAGLQTLEYLHKGGRLSRTSAAIGTVANIKPIITITKDGKVESCAKAIGVKRAIQTIVKQVESHQIDTQFDIWSLYSADAENCQALEAAMADIGYPVTGRMQIGPTIGAHTGPGVYGILFVEK